MDSSIILTIVIASLVLYLYLSKQQDPFENHGLPFKKPVPILGSSWRALLRLQPFAKMVEEIYNMAPECKYVGLHHRMAPVVMLRDPELMKSVAIKHFDHFPDHRGFGDDEIEPFFSKNLLLLRGDRWKEVRGLLSPAFTSSKMRAMFPLISACAANVGEYLASLPEEDRVIEMKDTFTRYTNDVFASCAFGIDVDSMNDRGNRFYELGKEALNIHSVSFIKLIVLNFSKRLSKLLDLQLIRREVKEFFEGVVSSSIRSRDEKGIVRPDLIQLMMETRGKLGPGKELTIQDMTAQAFVFFFGGFETTSSLVCFAVHELAVNPEIQEKLRSEVDQTLRDSKGEVTYEAMNEMKYLDAVVKETLRMYPVVPITDRQCSKRFELPPAMPGLKPFVLEEGSHVWLPIYAIQRDSKYFEDPERFNPGRFLRNREVVNCGAYVPFGMGPRVCIASRLAILQAKVAMFHVLARCQLEVCSRTSVPMVYGKRAFLTAEKGFWLQVRPRNNPLVSGPL